MFLAAVASSLTACGGQEASCEDTEGWMSVANAGANIHGDDATNFGQKLAPLEDLNGDGYDDFAVSHGGVYIFHGPIDESRTASDAVAFLDIEGAQSLPPVAPVGDVDGDGNGDLVIGITDGQLDIAGAYLALGPFEGELSWTPEDVLLLYIEDQHYGGTYDVEAFPSPSDGGKRGVAVRPPLPIEDEDHTRMVCIFHEAPTADTSLWDADVHLWQEVGGYPDEFLATSDTNGDGLHDYIVGATGISNGELETGGAYLVLGPGNGDIELGDADAILYGEEEADWAGDTVADAGDVNGDGYGDVLIGAPLHPDGGKSGAAYVLLGPIEGPIQLADADGRIYSSTTGARLGVSLDGAGDLNADGFDDIVIGAPEAIGCNGRQGQALLVLGPVEGNRSPIAPDYVLAGGDAYDCPGTTVAGAGDVDADGLADLLVGDPCYFNEHGNVTLVLGANL